MQIIVYFKFTINQKSSIDQISKNSKSKISKQHMFAKSIRIVFNKILFEKSIKLLYKLFHVFDETFFFIFIFFRFFFDFFFVFAFVSIVFVARMNCINVYQQVISIIDRVNIEFIASRRNWEKTRNKLLEYSVTKHQKFEFSMLYIQNHVQNQKEINNRLLVCFVNFFVLQHLHWYLNQYHRYVRIFLLRHSISHQNQWKNYQFHFFEHSYQNIKNFISLFMIWFACFVKSLNHLIYVNIKKDFVFSQNFDVRLFVTYQFRIIVYFLFAINQKTSIN